jgi:hypothetical protein
MGYFKSAFILFFVFLLLYTPNTFSQENKWGISFNGFVKTDYMFDSRQVVAARENHFLLYPKNEFLDAEGKDINAEPNFNILSIQTRLTGKIAGPDAFGAKTSGVVEGAFFGHSNSDVNGFRLRHAFVKLSWTNSSLLLGQYWHPMFITEVFPGVISFNTGVPFQPFSRNPQIRFEQKFSDVALILTAASQRDFASTGPAGVTSEYLQDAVIPILNLGLKYKSGNVIFGAGGNYMSLRPRLATDSLYLTDKCINSISFQAYFKYFSGAFSWKFEGVLGQNNYDLLMLGGYAVKSVDARTGREEYTNVKNLTFWTDLQYGKDLVLGLFAGYTKNQGAEDKVVGKAYARGTEIETVIRVSPRVQYTIGKTRFAAEVEYTAAAYGTPDEKLVVSNTKTVSNIRLLFAAFYLF